MQLDADHMINQVEIEGRKRLELIVIIAFNIILYLFLIFYIIALFVNAELFDIILFARLFRAISELIMTLGLIISAMKLVVTIRKLMQVVPNSLILWLVVGGFSSTIKCSEQLMFYYIEYNHIESYWLFVLILFLYNLDDLLPTVIFLQSFKVYSKFLKQNRESFESFDNKLTQRLEAMLEDSIESKTTQH